MQFVAPNMSMSLALIHTCTLCPHPGRNVTKNYTSGFMSTWNKFWCAAAAAAAAGRSRGLQ